jgi:hypothetical protein
MVGHEERIFRAASLDAFQEGYQDALQSPAGSVIRRQRNKVFQRLHVYESGYGDGWAMIHTVAYAWEPKGRKAATDDSVSLGGSTTCPQWFPRYDLPARVHAYGGPTEWLYSAEALWMMCQITWAWGRELRGFIDQAVGEMLKNIARQREDQTYNLRPTLPYEAN